MRGLLTAIYGLGLAFCAATATIERVDLAWTVVFLALGVELLALRLPDFGWVSFTFPCYTMALATPGLGGRAAALAALASLSLRYLRAWKQDPLAEMLQDGLPVAAALAAGSLLAWLGAAEPGGNFQLLIVNGLYLSGYWMTSPTLFGLAEHPLWKVSRRTLLPLLVAAVVLGGVGAVMFQAPTEAVLWLLPLPVMANLVGNTVLGAGQGQEEMGALQEAVGALEKTERKLGTRLRKARHDLDFRLEERILLEELAHTFAGNPELREVLEKATQMVGKVADCESIVFFTAEEDRLLPLYWHSPHGERLESSSLMGLGEPLAERAWRSKEIALLDPDRRGEERLLVGESTAVALPLRDVGVLYLGKREDLPFSERQLQLLSLLVDPMIPAIAAAQRKTELIETAEQLARSNRDLENANAYQATMLDAFKSLANQSGIEQLTESLCRQLANVVPTHDRGLILVGDKESEPFEQSWPEQEPLADLRSAAERLRTDDALVLQPEPFSLMGVRLVTEKTLVGVVVLYHPQPGRFSFTDLERLRTLSFHASSLLRNIQLLEQAQRTNQELREYQAQLIQSSKMAAVGQLAAGVAHQINSPLGAVVLALEMIGRAIKKEQPEKAMKHLAVADEAASAAKEIISNLLVYSRRSSSETGRVEVAKVVKRTAKMVQQQLQRDGVKLVTDLEPVSGLTGRGGDLQQILTNLIINGRDAVLLPGASKPEVHVSTRETEKEVKICVADYGPGFEPEAEERLFEPFFTTKPVGSGTGLGLSVGLKLAEGLGGKILPSRSDGMTRFTVILPRNRT